MTTAPTPSLFDPVDPNALPRDKPRLSEQCLTVLRRLRQGPLTEADVYPAIKRLAARVHDLREHGLQIDTDRQGATARYCLKSETVWSRCV